ncbi:hypothetical protein ACIBMX_34615 [Streptomyces phaeochromogenes]|uniref:hypothetical protein n=1 Tax=Streptomyces phaeochromogenes TaxID=1923 RepID=UPI0033D24CA4
MRGRDAAGAGARRRPRRHAAAAAASGGYYGIVCLTERVTVLGGELHTGPRPDTGWEAMALLPTMGTGARRLAL